VKLFDQEEKLELDRIRTAYLRWRRELPLDRYARINPAQLYSLHDLEQELLHLLRVEGIRSLAGMRVLEVGCGGGKMLRQLLEYGADPDRLLGVDLVFENLEESRRLAPHIKTLCCSASHLPFPDASFDFVLQFAVFTSVLSSAMRQGIANEISRVLVPGGTLIWYDSAYDNPRNPNVRGIGREEIKRLFPHFTIRSRRLTLAPPLGRMLARFGPTVYHAATTTKVFCTHNLCLMRKPA
jgi:ubiquinone/menaquinone biosynthesis C-methylase UbiE